MKTRPLRIGTRLVVLPVSVLDKNGKLVTDLHAEGVQGFRKRRRAADQDLPPRRCADFARHHHRQQRQHAREAAEGGGRFARSGARLPIRRTKSSSSISTTIAYLDVPFTNDIKKMEEGIARIDSRGGTAMRDAISMSMDYLQEGRPAAEESAAGDHRRQRQRQQHQPGKAGDRAQQSEVLIYSIGLLNEEERREARLAKRALDAISRDSGGLAFYPKGPAEVDAIALQVAHEIRNQYTIAYSPTVQADGRQLPPDQSDGERSRASDGAHAHRLLRDARYVRQENSEPTALMLRFLWRATQRISILSLAQPLSALAHGNVLGRFCRAKSDFTTSGALCGSTAAI